MLSVRGRTPASSISARRWFDGPTRLAMAIVLVASASWADSRIMIPNRLALVRGSRGLGDAEADTTAGSRRPPGQARPSTPGDQPRRLVHSLPDRPLRRRF
jgi:hypothetical protein